MEKTERKYVKRTQKDYSMSQKGSTLSELKRTTACPLNYR